MEQNGYEAEVKDVPDLTPVRAEYNVPIEIQSCHTAIVDGYIVEGHVPVDEIERLLSERPEGIMGIAVPGMPIGSPGMDVDGFMDQPFEVIAFDQAGNTEVFATYPK